MSRYIEKEKVISAVCFGCNQQFSDEPCEPSECSIRQAINSIPTADVVEVVRCLDCQWCEQVEGKNNVWSCYCRRFRHSREVDVRDYCSYGERKENGT